MEPYTITEALPYQAAQIMYEGKCKYCLYHDTTLDRAIIEICQSGWFSFIDKNITFHEAMKELGHRYYTLNLNDLYGAPDMDSAAYMDTAIVKLPLSLVTVCPIAHC